MSALFWRQPSYGMIEIAGPDGRDFLQRLTSQEFRTLREGQTLCGAALTPTSQVIAPFLATLFHGTIFLLVPVVPGRELTKTLAAFLEKMHFAEDLTIKDVSADFQSFVVCNKVLESGELVFKFRDFAIYPLKSESQTLNVLMSQLQEGTSQDYDFLMAKVGFPQWGVDFTEKNLILEGPFSDFVSRNKGCYPGQEVVERVHTYGNVAKKLVRIGGDPKELLTLKQGDKIKAGDLEIGTITSSLANSRNDDAIVTALVRKPHYKPQTKVKVGSFELEVQTIPHTFEIED